MSEVVTIGVPVHKRLHFLHRALHSIAAQDYPAVELLVSDNGLNGEALDKLVAAHYPRPYRLRRNEGIVSIPEHFNQIVTEASGKYLTIVADDDEIGPNFVSSLVAVLGTEPTVGVALSRLDVIDESDEIESDADRGTPPPARMGAPEFVRIWCRGEYRFVCFTTFLARTADIRAVGAYPQFSTGTAIDNALVLKLVLDRQIAYVSHAVFRYRVYEASHGLALPWRRLAFDLKGFIHFLDHDPLLQDYARREPRSWREMRSQLLRMTWGTYRSRWRKMYRRRLSSREWVRAAFAMPLIPEYYRSVIRTLVRAGLSTAKRQLVAGRPGESSSP